MPTIGLMGGSADRAYGTGCLLLSPRWLGEWVYGSEETSHNVLALTRRAVKAWVDR